MNFTHKSGATATANLSSTPASPPANIYGHHGRRLQIVTSSPVAGAVEMGSAAFSPGAKMAVSSAMQLIASSFQTGTSGLHPSQPIFSLPGRSLPVGVVPSSLNADVTQDGTAQMGAVQQSMQDAVAEAASVASVALRSAQEAEQSLESMLSDTTSRVPGYADVQKALESALNAELGPGATNVFLGLGGAVLTLMALVAFQIIQRQKSETVCSLVLEPASCTITSLWC